MCTHSNDDNVSSKLMKLTNVQRVTVFIWPSFLGIHHTHNQSTICAHIVRTHSANSWLLGEMWVCADTYCTISPTDEKPCLDERICCLSSFNHNNHLISMLILCWFFLSASCDPTWLPFSFRSASAFYRSMAVRLHLHVYALLAAYIFHHKLLRLLFFYQLNVSNKVNLCAFKYAKCKFFTWSNLCTNWIVWWWRKWNITLN